LHELNVKSTAIEAAANAMSSVTEKSDRVPTRTTRLTAFQEARGHHIWFLMSDGHEAELYKELWDTIR
jgi:hypothetical protein